MTQAPPTAPLKTPLLIRVHNTLDALQSAARFWRQQLNPFGDNTIGVGATLTHTYMLTGTYTAALTATNLCGRATVSHTLTVVAPEVTPHLIYLPLVLREVSLPAAQQKAPEDNFPALP